VVGAPSAELGEEVVAFVVKRGAVAEAALTAHCRSSLAPYKLPRRIVFLDEMPKNNSGKVDKRALARKLPTA
jgi:acyl-CoA synthetase (AMP-forming)/AMP-acid ligase II